MTVAVDERVRARVEVVTPEIAARWLEERAANRNIVQSTVDKYVRDIIEGVWEVGPPLMFDRNGKLIDGQHRLWAVIQADRAVEFVIIRGLAPEAVSVIDTGMKRTLAHALQITGEKDTMHLSSIVNLCWRYQQDRCVSNSYPTHTEAFVWLAENPGVRSAVTVSRRVYSVLRAPTTAVGTAYYLNALVDAEASERFWRDVETGGGIMLAYRRWVASTLSRREKPTPKVWLAYNLKAMNVWRKGGRSPQVLHWRGEEGMPDTWSV